jgi:hypothetical protein
MSINWQLLRELRERWLRLEQSQAKDTDIIIYESLRHHSQRLKVNHHAGGHHEATQVQGKDSATRTDRP